MDFPAIFPIPSISASALICKIGALKIIPYNFSHHRVAWIYQKQQKTICPKSLVNHSLFLFKLEIMEDHYALVSLDLHRPQNSP